MYPDSGVSQIYLSKQACYGHVIDDTVVFDHSYTNCSTSKTVRNSYFFIKHLTAKLEYFIVFLIVLKKEYFKPDSWYYVRNVQILIYDIIFIIQVSDQFVMYSNQLVYPESSKPFPLIIHGYRWRVDVNCDIDRFEHVTQHYKPTEAPLTQTTVHHQVGGTGHYDIKLQFFTDSQYFHEINVS